MTVHFDGASRAATNLALRLDQHGIRVMVVRDIVGRLSLVVDDRHQEISSSDISAWTAEMREVTAQFVSQAPVVVATQLFDPDDIFSSSDRLPLDLASPSAIGSGLLDRGIVGTEWKRVEASPAARRVTLYGYKGGVGRSTATFMLAKHLADSGHSVLVVDLDLESPGIGPLMHTGSGGPDFGLVDYLVESAVGEVQEMDLVVRSDRIYPRGNGEVWIAPARGRVRDGYTYLPKLNRVYADLPTPSGLGAVSFASRLGRAIAACEAEVQRRSRFPDAVLLDSRAGIHDVAAAAITQLSDLSLLFATDNQQTWIGYSDLFSQWQAAGAAELIRDRLRMVASMTPPRSPDVYLERFRDRAQECFARTLYDDTTGADPNAYNPAPEDEAAPHSPLPILFAADLLGLDHENSPDWHESEFVRAAYAQFTSAVTDLIYGAYDG
jgi:hypothetical protein